MACRPGSAGRHRHRTWTRSSRSRAEHTLPSPAASGASARAYSSLYSAAECGRNLEAQARSGIAATRCTSARTRLGRGCDQRGAVVRGWMGGRRTRTLAPQPSLLRPRPRPRRQAGATGMCAAGEAHYCGGGSSAEAPRSRPFPARKHADPSRYPPPAALAPTVADPAARRLWRHLRRTTLRAAVGPVVAAVAVAVGVHVCVGGCQLSVSGRELPTSAPDAESEPRSPPIAEAPRQGPWRTRCRTRSDRASRTQRARARADTWGMVSPIPLATRHSHAPRVRGSVHQRDSRLLQVRLD